MDDISGKITELLSNPDMMNQIKGLLGGIGDGEPPKKEAAEAQNKEGSLSPDMMNTVMKIMPLISSFNKEDDSIRLLYALRPLLGEKRKMKLDESIKMMQMMRVLPLIKKQGIL